jgi:hypothetical protein
MGMMIAILIGLLLSIHGGYIGRNLWRIDSRIGLAWRSEHVYVTSMRLVGGLIIAMGLVAH